MQDLDIYHICVPNKTDHQVNPLSFSKRHIIVTKTKPENSRVCFQVPGPTVDATFVQPVHSMGIRWQWCGDTCTLTCSPIS